MKKFLMNKKQQNQVYINKIYKHAKQMKERSVNGDGQCRYLAPDGNKCFVGCLLAKEALVSGDIEGCSAVDSEVSDLLIDPDSDLLQDLQDLHDREDKWDENGFQAWFSFRKLVEYHGYKMPFHID